ncbi:hypothetical protein SAMN00120144_1122 [Hymenobacter roseosalivarius DSM 11622]|uniref:DUF2723 domain-containing protein n=1 Tax=Hymenobacter roseosalivarius DSM 11622 TaxID=645990 RepID=A0A1W1V4M3_9BACT|nr:DUF2723 domain-containing protein [Hymenobacter roseosalivarius]SMB87981.1 hypothetical protein SAMN00120144_1122 [Hymenobacter roseosalivarius DSM 11622]
MNYQRTNNLLGWLLFAGALTVYLLTLEPTASFWDCAEFIATSHHLLVPHPPGAPLFLLLGRVFSLFSFGDASLVAGLINGVSAVSSAFTVLFLFWTITMLARKLVQGHASTTEPSLPETALILGAGAVGASAFAFSDTFWFNAVEAEVYALSTLCTAFVVWTMLKWENRAHEPGSDRWLILIAYAVGLSIGVHLLNLLALPALGFIYYFRRSARPTWLGGILTLVVSGAILGGILVGVIPGLPTLAGSFEVFFVNSMGLPFNSGVLVFLALFLGTIVFGFRYANRTQNQLLNTGLLAFVFILIGYSSYLIVPIRSGFNPTIDENKPDEVLSFVSYLKREQYGDRPLLYGPQFNAQPIAQTQGAPRYIRQGNKYVISDHRLENEYATADNTLLPRLYSNRPGHISEYQKWVDVREDVKPTMGQNLAFLWRYQLGHMYWRYFLWNFVGRESDVQQAGSLLPGATKNGLPQLLADNKARNNFLLLPLLLGGLGLVYQARRDGRKTLVLGLLFGLTGVAIVLYLNQPPIEPRERDYTSVGSFYAFAIWMGLGVLGLHEVLRYLLRTPNLRVATAMVLGLLVPGILAVEGWNDHDRSGRYSAADSAYNLLNSCAPNAILITYADNDTFPLWYAQEVEGIRRDVRIAVLQYLPTDWHIEQLRRRSYESAPVALTLPTSSYQSGTNDYLPYVANPAVPAVNVQEFMQLVRENSPLLQVQTQSGQTMLSYPSDKFYLPIDKEKVKRLGIIPQERESHLVDRMEWSMGKQYLDKSKLVILDILASNDWRRPVYFANAVAQQEGMGLEPYLQLEGMAYRILPCRNPDPQPQRVGYVARQLTYDSLMNKFAYRNLNNPKVYYDEINRRTLAQYRDKFGQLAQAYLHAGEPLKAKEVALRCLQVMPDAAIPYDLYTPELVAPLAAGGEKPRANEIMDTLTSRTQQSLAYYRTHDDRALFEQEVATNLMTLQRLYQAATDTGDQVRAARVVALAEQYGR